MTQCEDVYFQDKNMADDLIKGFLANPEEEVEHSSMIRNVAIYTLGKIIENNNEKNVPTGIIILKILALKEINSTFGFTKGDSFLINCLSRIRQGLLPGDIIYKISENEFLIYYSKIINEGHIILAANKLYKLFKQPLSVDQDYITAKLRMGIAMYPDHANSAEELLKKAFFALDKAIKDKCPYSIWPTDQQSETKSNIILETELKSAIDENTIYLNYQPKLHIKTNKITGVECLARWESPTYGLIPPDYFISIAENADLIDALTLKIINMALCESRECGDNNNFSLSINLSAVNLLNSDIVEMIRRAINVWDTRPDKLIFEVTESAIMLNPELSLTILKQLTNIGISISIDDFGTGYSSFSYLKKLPVKELKIDKSFIFNLVTDKEDAIITQAMIGLAHSFDLFVTAEGVENLETLKMLSDLDCEYAQGYYIARPMSNEKLKEWVYQ
jgi:diguanylate cyclase (GGDEF)-like protein